MVNSISLQNFKCYKDKTRFPLSKINLLTGINGKGKSTFLQSILLFKQSVEHSSSASTLILNGDYVKLGAFKDVRNADTSTSKSILIEFEFSTQVPLTMIHPIGLDENGEEDTDIFEYDESCNFTLRYELINQESRNFELFIDNIKLDASKLDFLGGTSLNFKQWKDDKNEYKGTFIKAELMSGIEEFRRALGGFKQIKSKTYKEQRDKLLNLLPNMEIKLDEDEYQKNTLLVHTIINFFAIQFVSADRLGPQEYYPKSLLGNFLEVGKQGEKVVDVLSKVKNNVLNNQSDSRILGESNNIHSLVGAWLSHILDTKVSIIVDSDSSYISTLKFGFINDKEYTPPNVGFGYSYILPIIVSGLIAQENEILIIENPEAHLHPRAQSRLAQFLARVASTGVQVFIESHSEHILNGIRLATIERDNSPRILEHTEVSVLYFKQDENEPFVQIPLEKGGKIRKWPNGFFDQLEKDTELLYGL